MSAFERSLDVRYGSRTLEAASCTVQVRQCMRDIQSELLLATYATTSIPAPLLDSQPGAAPCCKRHQWHTCHLWIQKLSQEAVQFCVSQGECMKWSCIVSCGRGKRYRKYVSLQFTHPGTLTTVLRLLLA